MKYMILAAETAEDFALRDDQEKFENYIGEWFVFSQKMQPITLVGAALETPQSATVVSVRDGQREIQDGPFPDTKEQLGGFFIIDAPNQAIAEEWAAKCPAAKTGFAELHAIPYLNEGELS